MRAAEWAETAGLRPTPQLKKQDFTGGELHTCEQEARLHFSSANPFHVQTKNYGKVKISKGQRNKA